MECVRCVAGVPAAAVLPDQRRVPVQSVSVPQDTEEHCAVTALQGTASAALCACSDQLFSDTSLCIIFLGPDCFWIFLQVVMVDFFMADQLCSQVPVHN